MPEQYSLLAGQQKLPRHVWPVRHSESKQQNASVFSTQPSPGQHVRPASQQPLGTRLQVSPEHGLGNLGPLKPRRAAPAGS